MGRHKRATAAHYAEAEQMLAGGWRAECHCGWWQDTATRELAHAAAKRHNRTGSTSCGACKAWELRNPPSAWPTMNAHLLAMVVEHRRHREAAP